MVRFAYSREGTGSLCFRRPLTAPLNLRETMTLKANCGNHPCGQQEPGQERRREIDGIGDGGIRLAKFIFGVRPFLGIHYPNLSEPNENLRIET